MSWVVDRATFLVSWAVGRATFLVSWAVGRATFLVSTCLKDLPSPQSLMRLVVCEDGAVTVPALECCLQLLHRLKGRLEHSDSILIKGETSQVS